MVKVGVSKLFLKEFEGSLSRKLSWSMKTTMTEDLQVIRCSYIQVLLGLGKRILMSGFLLSSVILMLCEYINITLYCGLTSIDGILCYHFYLWGSLILMYIDVVSKIFLFTGIDMYRYLYVSMYNFGVIVIFLKFLIYVVRNYLQRSQKYKIYEKRMKI